ncbi:MAG: prophage antirepressor [Syntrophaceae bacterium]|nr:MAG: prophage antirepressor [Syntrophaceae bacterium]
MNKEQALVTFEKYKIRRLYDEQKATWYFSVIDVVATLTDSANPRDYWFKMKTRVKSEGGFELSTICRQFKMKAPDGKIKQKMGFAGHRQKNGLPFVRKNDLYF